MANDFEGHQYDEKGSMTAAEARATLNGISHDGTALAARIVTPWWYHPALGLIVAVFVGAQALPGVWPLSLMALGIISIPVLMSTYARRYGVAVSQPAGPRGRRLMLSMLAVIAVGMLSSLALKVLALEPGWALIPGLAAFAMTVILGRRYDEALRQELPVRTGEQA